MNDFTFNIEDRGLQYCGAARIEGPLVVVERVRDVGYDEVVEILGPDGRPRIGRVLDISETSCRGAGFGRNDRAFKSNVACSVSW